jgi:prolyl oligopeptidase
MSATVVEPNTSERTRYPHAPRQDLVEHRFGYRIPDPYRWLEDPSDPATERWSEQQDELARRVLDALPGRDRLAERLSVLLNTGSISAPQWRAGRRFYTRREPGQEYAVLHVTEPDGTERALLDPLALDPSGLTTLDSWVPDLEGRQLAYHLSQGGDEHSVLHVMDVTTGEPLQPPIDRCRFSSMTWLPGGQELFYVRMVAKHEVAPDQQAFHRRIWRHRIGAAQDRGELVEGPGLYTDHNYYSVQVSRDGRWLLVSGNVGTARRDSLWIAKLGAGCTPKLTPVLRQTDDIQAHAWVDHDGLLYLHTTDNAPRWRLMVTDPTTPTRANWRELVAEDPDSVLEAVRWLRPSVDTDPADGLLVLARARHAVAELALHRPSDGAQAGTVPLPGTGSLTGLTVADRNTPGQHGRLWFGWTDLITPPEVHRFDLTTGVTMLESPSPGQVVVPAVRTEQREFHSADGTAVRMFVISPAADTGPRPALLTGYGGFAISLEPAYAASALAWVSAGGVYALASLRGGGEEGEAWHRAGMREHKQNVFDDLHAAADALVTAGDTTHEQLAVLGGSNGGLLVGAALTQRPAAYRAVVCSAPLLDMVRYEQFSIGRTWNHEYGTADKETELGWLLSYSPYHRVRPGTEYPAVLFTVFDSDSRVDPAHARKMCAALQHVTVGDPGTRPILLRRERDVGHSTRSVSRALALSVDQLAFLAGHTGLDLS